MPFVNEQVERNLIKEFARITGVKPNEVEVEIQDRLDVQSIRLKSTLQLKDEMRETELSITRTGRDTFSFTGYITITGKAMRKRDISQTYKGYPEALPKALVKILSIAKVKKGWLPF
jgi:hypothetical protein